MALRRRRPGLRRRPGGAAEELRRRGPGGGAAPAGAAGPGPVAGGARLRPAARRCGTGPARSRLRRPGGTGPRARPGPRAPPRAALAEHTGVLALGGGAILDAGTRALLAGRPVVYLSMDVEEAVRRVGLGAARPLLAVNPRRQWRELMDARRHLYTEVARVVVATDGKSPEEVADAIVDALELKDR
ncbi:shikimate kinase [Streptomyces sp. NPDC052644]